MYIYKLLNKVNYKLEQNNVTQCTAFA